MRNDAKQRIECNCRVATITLTTRAFTLLEMLVVAGIVALLAALLLPALSRAKGRTRSSVCGNHLRQLGLALQMYVSDHSMYPSALGGGGPPFKSWEHQLAAYNPLPWTNVAWHCPTYIAKGGIVQWESPPPGGGRFKHSSSYSYNAWGIWGYAMAGSSALSKGPWLGLGDLNVMVRENRIVNPSQMYAIADNRPIQNQNSDGFLGKAEMQPWQLMASSLNARYSEAPPPHAESYNVLCADGHVEPVKRKNYLYPPRTAQNWNRDNQPHPELWCPTNEWVIQN
jgi:prepilin-type N-terminal cleavage/methylation domain-containing protein/prepilin-type processing-associated H-X9-DG protein